jgi:hypothetical protein
MKLIPKACPYISDLPCILVLLLLGIWSEKTDSNEEQEAY